MSSPENDDREQVRNEILRSTSSASATVPPAVSRLTNLLAVLERHQRELECDAAGPATALSTAAERAAAPCVGRF